MARSRGTILQDDGAELYQLVAGDWNDQALATLSDFGDAPSEAALITAARLLAHAPVMVLSAQVPLIANLLHRAESLGKDSAELVLQRFSQRPASLPGSSASSRRKTNMNSNKLAGS